MMKKLVEGYCILAALLRKEIVRLRDYQKKKPEMADDYEEKIRFLFEEYDHFLNVSGRLFDYPETEETT